MKHMIIALFVCVSILTLTWFAMMWDDRNQALYKAYCLERGWGFTQGYGYRACYDPVTAEYHFFNSSAVRNGHK